jgi:hypothetical protein
MLANAERSIKRSWQMIFGKQASAYRRYNLSSKVDNLLRIRTFPERVVILSELI